MLAVPWAASRWAAWLQHSCGGQLHAHWWPHSKHTRGVCSSAPCTGPSPGRPPGLCTETLRSTATGTVMEATLNHCRNRIVGKCPSLSSGGKIPGPILCFPWDWVPVVHSGRSSLTPTFLAFLSFLSHTCCSASWDHILNELTAPISLSRALL